MHPETPDARHARVVSETFNANQRLGRPDPDMEPVGADAEFADQLEDVRAVVAIQIRQIRDLSGEVEGLTERLVALMGTVEQLSAVVAVQTDLIAALTPEVQ